ncbi:unnamed protein product, partial [Heterosigma akashiwo]
MSLFQLAGRVNDLADVQGCTASLRISASRKGDRPDIFKRAAGGWLANHGLSPFLQDQQAAAVPRGRHAGDGGGGRRRRRRGRGRARP